MKVKAAQKFPEIPFSKLLSEKILPFSGPAKLSGDQQAYDDGILLLSTEMVVLFANQQASYLLSTSSDDLLGKQLDIPGLGSHTNLLHAVTVDNSERIIELRTNSLSIEGVDYILAILQDITQQFESIKRLNFAIDATELGLWDHNFMTNSTSINPYYASMLGYTFEEFESSNWIKMVHPIDLDEVWNSWNKHIAGQIPFYQAEYRIHTRNGPWKWIYARGQVKDRNAQGDPLHFIGSHQDITASKQARRELQLQYEINAISSDLITLEQKLERMLKNILPILIADKGLLYLSDQQGNLVLSASSDFSLMEIYDVDQLSAQLLGAIKEGMKVFVPDKSSKLAKQLLNAAGAELAAAYPLRVQSQFLGVLAVFWTTSQPFTDLDDHIISVAANQLAVSIEREYLRQTAGIAALVEERQRLARELHDSLSQSLYSVLLSADGGQGFSRLGNFEKTEEIFNNIKETMQQALKEMRLIVYELRPSILAREGLHQALERRLESVEKRAGLSAVLVDNLSSLPSAEIEAQLYGIAQESLNNVLRHANAESVEISLDQQGDHILMQIIDDGQGFDCRKVGKSGFGINNIKERARQIGGKAEVESHVGHGTHISVRVPAQEKSDNTREVQANGS